ncbi:selenocysteine lyase SclA [Enterococcus rivorum]|uniref:cysteine desulfurase n=1 Tax=Enterococcus rivorum TaxID=762845 RepID=A0A1E5KTJ6_9ENTE|nr:selenocysteine lyase SclA [Enterococcus rivorum]MBP2097943.1 cysteine desulfurase family protein [Enterococcus rivorum]OEH81204.1 class V aminotransferase [Enterococcus rivorum]
MNEPVYLNYAATSNKRPKVVIDQLCNYLQNNNSKASNRGLQENDDASIAFETRLILSSFFNAPDPAHVLFTQNITTSLNMLLNGLLQKGDHVVTTSIEHNAVARPLHLLEKKRAISVTYVNCSLEGQLTAKQIETAFQPETKLLVMNHASNVLGTILPIKECFEIAKKHGIITVLDTAQTAGFLPIDMKEMNIDILAFTGHKGLMGIAGIGGFALGKGISTTISPWLTGGTGSTSQSFQQPDFLPDKFEPGTPNTLGILSLGSSVSYLQEVGLETIYTHEKKLTEQFLTGITGLPLNILGTKNAALSVPVVSIVDFKKDPGELAQQLYEDYGIITRCGLHCSPLAHQTAGTIETGAVRFSFGWHTTPSEVDYAISVLNKIYRKS